MSLVNLVFPLGVIAPAASALLPRSCPSGIGRLVASWCLRIRAHVIASISARLKAEYYPALKKSAAGREKQFWNNIQILRLIAAYGIVYIHLDALFRSIGSLSILIDILRFGTDLFVVVSGFLTAFVLTSSPKSGFDYLRNRAIRIIPLYVLFTVLAFFVQEYVMKHHVNTFSELLMSLAFIPYGPFPVLYPTWTLQIIVEFSLIVGICHMLTKDYSVYVASVIVLIITVVGVFSGFTNSALVFYTNPMLIDFAFGVLIFKLITSDVASFLPARGAVLFAIAIIGACSIAIVMRPFYWPELPRLIALGIPASGLLLGALALERAGAVVESKLVNFLAKCTYAIYLCHWFVNIVSEKILADSGESAAMAALLLIVTPLIVTVVAVLVYLYVEVPTTKYLIRRFAGKKAASGEPKVRFAESA